MYRVIIVKDLEKDTSEALEVLLPTRIGIRILDTWRGGGMPL